MLHFLRICIQKNLETKMIIQKFWVKLDFPNFILDFKIPEKDFVKWVKFYFQNRAEYAPSTELKDKSVKNSLSLRKF